MMKKQEGQIQIEQEGNFRALSKETIGANFSLQQENHSKS
jgi:hypothetical protein